ncbi:hypothetical protein [Rhizobium sp. SYY.PMSO]
MGAVTRLSAAGPHGGTSAAQRDVATTAGKKQKAGMRDPGFQVDLQ